MDGLDFSHSGAVHMELLATCIRILLFARFTIDPVALNAIWALPQFIGVDYVTPLHGDTLLHIAAMRSDAETIEGLLGDPRFTRTLAKNGFGLRAYEYASTPPILTLILEGAVQYTNRLFKAKELMAHRDNVRCAIDAVKTKGLLQNRLSAADRKALERLSADVKYSQHLAQGGGGSIPMAAAADGGGATLSTAVSPLRGRQQQTSSQQRPSPHHGRSDAVLEASNVANPPSVPPSGPTHSTAIDMATADDPSHLRDVFEGQLTLTVSDGALVEEIMEAVRQGAEALEAKNHSQRVTFNSLQMSDGAGNALVQFPLCVISSRFLAETVSAQHSAARGDGRFDVMAGMLGIEPICSATTGGRNNNTTTKGSDMSEATAPSPPPANSNDNAMAEGTPKQQQQQLQPNFTSSLVTAFTSHGGLLVECEDAFGYITHHADKAVLVRTYMPAIVQGKHVLHAVYEVASPSGTATTPQQHVSPSSASAPLPFLQPISKAPIHKGLSVRAANDFLRFTFPFEYVALGPSQHEQPQRCVGSVGRHGGGSVGVGDRPAAPTSQPPGQSRPTAGPKPQHRRGIHHDGPAHVAGSPQWGLAVSEACSRGGR